MGDVVRDDSLVHVVAKYPRWAEMVYQYRPIEMPVPELEAGLQPWQIQLKDYLDGEPKTRTIFWVWSAEHSTGKSTFKHYLQTVGYDILDGDLTYRDLMDAYDGQKIIWFDFCKTNTGGFNDKFETLRNNILERMSNHGMHFSPKFKSGCKPVLAHIVVTANDPPPYAALEKRIVEILATPLPDVLQDGDVPSTPAPPTPAAVILPPTPPSFSDDEPLPQTRPGTPTELHYSQDALTQEFMSSSEAEDEGAEGAEDEGEDSD